MSWDVGNSCRASPPRIVRIGVAIVAFIAEQKCRSYDQFRTPRVFSLAIMSRIGMVLSMTLLLALGLVPAVTTSTWSGRSSYTFGHITVKSPVRRTKMIGTSQPST
jgi:hypothetical protein